MAKDKEDKPASTRAQAVTGFTVPVTAAWLLAVAGIVGWNVPAETLLANAGGIVAALGAGVAFLTVVLSAVQDMVPLRLKQWLLFPWLWPPFPSYHAFSEGRMTKAKLGILPPIKGMPEISGETALEGLRGKPEDQDERWIAYYQAHSAHPAVVHFSTRHLAWRDMVPVMMLLIISTLVLRRLIETPETHQLWAWLLEGCGALLAMSWLAGHNSNRALIIAVLERVQRDDATPKTAKDGPSGPFFYSLLVASSPAGDATK